MVAALYQYRFKNREGLILEWNDGFGEIAPLPGFSRETLEDARAEILALLPNLDNAKPKFPSVQFGLLCASQPFSFLPLRIPLCALNHPRPNCPSLKLKLGHLPLDDAIAQTKQYVGRYRLRLDCNRAWNLDQALQFTSHFSPSDFEYLEEPLNCFSDLIRFSELTRFPIAVDESLRDSDYLQIPTLKAAIVKPTLMGTLPLLPSHIPCVLSSSYETSLGILQIARLASGDVAQGLDTFSDDLLTSSLRVEDGHLLWIPSQPPIDFSKLCLIASAP